MTFSLAFARDTLHVLQQCAYIYPFSLPSPWRIISEIQPGNFGYIATDGTDTVIVFRGTSNQQEWIEDFDAVAVACSFGPPGIIHAGIQLQYHALRDSIRNTKLPTTGNLYVSGHSLGGGLAIYCAADLAYMGEQVVCYTWGGPRVAWHGKGEPSVFAEWCDKQFPTYRIVNDWDIVPRVPLCEQGYVHLGQEALIDAGIRFDLIGDPKALVRYNHVIIGEGGHPDCYAVGLKQLSEPVNLQKVD